MNGISRKFQAWTAPAAQLPKTGLQRRVFTALVWASWVYGGAAAARRSFYRKRILKGKRLPCPVISVGNLTVGGTGKTPMVAYLARLIQDLGYHPAILSRGYGGQAQKHGGVVSDGTSRFMTAEAAGDEPFMLAEQLEAVPVLVGSNRFRSGILAIRQYHSEILLLDDGFQHLTLERDLDVVLFDSRHPIGNGHLLPRGTLREPVSALSMADGFVFTRCDPGSGSSAKMPRFFGRQAKWGKPVFFSAHFPVTYHSTEGRLKGCDPHHVEGKRGVAFSGIARNDDFQRSLRSLGCDIASFFGFPDHHPYTHKELAAIWSEGQRKGAAFVATTEKDHARIRGRVPMGIPLVVLGIQLRLLGDPTVFSRWIEGVLRSGSKRLLDHF